MKIVPVNGHIQIKPIKRESIIASSERDYDAKGTVISGNNFIVEGVTVYFDASLASKFNPDTEEEFWLLPYEAVRAYESLAE